MASIMRSESEVRGTSGVKVRTPLRGGLSATDGGVG